jgi:bifunctional non-homologous end joining protein LigD
MLIARRMVAPNLLLDSPVTLETHGASPVYAILHRDTMQPTQVARPFHVEGFVYEEKVDGYRMLAYKLDGTVRLISRQGVEHTRRFRDIAAAVAALPHDTLILDGEVAVFDEQLVSRFEWLRGTKPSDVATPPIFMAFDALLVNRQDLRKLPLTERRKVVEEVTEDQSLILPVRRLALDGMEAWREVIRCGYEGLVAKDERSPYVEGRTLAWRKVKQKEYRVVERGFYQNKPESVVG